MKTLVGVFAVVSLLAHVAALPPSLEDLDSVNFALGVRHFDVAQHQPHPPGYPVFIALGKLSTSAFRLAGVAAPDVRGLAIWSALGAAALPLLIFLFFRALHEGEERRAAIAAVIAGCCPLVWFSGVRPLSDMAGLAAAWTALAALAIGTRKSGGQGARGPGEKGGQGARGPKESGSQRARGPGADIWLIGGAFIAGVAIGFRSQMALLTLPFLLAVLVMIRRRRLALLGAVVAGVAVWAIPLVFSSGGPAAYVHALGSQAGEDFSGVVMLWTHRTPRAALAAFLQTFVRPWESPVLAGVMLALAVGGVCSLAVQRAWRMLFFLAIAFGPYAIFHLLFQETVTIRYALPLIPLVAYLAAEALAEAEPRASLVVTAALAAVALAAAIPATMAFANTPSPVFGLLSEMRIVQARGAAPIVAMHRRVFTESRRARLYDGDVPGKLLAVPRDYEWLELTRAWRDGHDGETWFVADPRRTDLALIDREHVRTRQYRWPFDAAVYVGGARPGEIDWHVIIEPGWFLEQGWALTPEIAGITDRDGWGPHRRPSIGWVRRRAGETVMMIGGRHLGGDPPARVTVNIDDGQAATFDVRPGYFLNFVTLPAGALTGDGRLAKLTVSAASTGAAPAPPVAIEQFNLQDPDRVQWAYDEGWFEPELNPTTARSWRWTSEKATLRVHGGGQAVRMRMTVESPRHYFMDAPHVRVSAGDRVLADLTPAADFSVDVSVPADVLAAAQGRITVTSDRSYVAGEREGTADRRRLALRVYSVTIERQTP